jgi:hypothetical protein
LVGKGISRERRRVSVIGTNLDRKAFQILQNEITGQKSLNQKDNRIRTITTGSFKMRTE